MSQLAGHLALWLEKLDCLRKLESGWNRRGAPAPSEIAIHMAGLFLQVMTDRGLEPTRLAASAVGGVGITRRRGERMAYVEFYNDGSACALFSDEANEGETIRIRSDRESFNLLLSQMEAYLNG